MNFGWNAYKLIHWYPHTGTSLLSKDSNIETKNGQWFTKHYCQQFLWSITINTIVYFRYYTSNYNILTNKHNFFLLIHCIFTFTAKGMQIFNNKQCCSFVNI